MNANYLPISIFRIASLFVTTDIAKRNQCCVETFNDNIDGIQVHKAEHGKWHLFKVLFDDKCGLWSIFNQTTRINKILFRGQFETIFLNNIFYSVSPSSWTVQWLMIDDYRFRTHLDDPVHEQTFFFFSLHLNDFATA